MFFVVKERNAFADLINSQGLNIDEFHLLNTDKYHVVFKPLALAFSVTRNPRAGVLVGPYDLKTVPGGIVDAFHANGMSWNELLSAFQKWITIIREELEIPDLWKAAKKSAPFLSSASNLADDMFSVEEVQLLAERVQIVENKIKELDLPKEAKDAIVEIARDVPTEAKFFTKKKLGEVVVGQLISQGMKWGLTTEHMQAVWHVFQGFTHLFIS
jgi:hypothetical protein